ncbi:MAG TPA: tryptophan--tRNA ligase [Actinomycetota bacterium]|nr:tryptophan--tRNA ligase [Actinomycetota bacterium]
MTKVFSGVQPTSDVPHLGNYIGAFRNWVTLQDRYQSLYCIVDLHSMTVAWDPTILARRTLQSAASLIALGIDPERSVLFVQSDVREHTELAWILNCIARMGELNRMTQFKDKARNQEASVGAGLFAYPVLMAADVLVHRAHLVPVGDDQKQHLELMRDIAERFNRSFGETFPIPDPLIPDVGGRVMSLDDPTKKMDKSSDRPGSLIWMTDPPEVVRSKIAKAVTDSGREIVYGPEKPALSNLLDIFSAVSGREVSDIQESFVGKGYADLKAELSDALIEFLSPFQERYSELMKDTAELGKLLDRGADSARQEAAETMKIVRERVGLRASS